MSAIWSLLVFMGLFLMFGAFAVADRGNRSCHDCPTPAGGCGACELEAPQGDEE